MGDRTVSQQIDNCYINDQLSRDPNFYRFQGGQANFKIPQLK